MGNVFKNHDESSVSLGSYKPWHIHKGEGGDGSNYPPHSGWILDVKDAKPHGVKHFADILDPDLHHNIAIAVVPSHDPAKGGGGLSMLAAALSANGKRIDASKALLRTKKINKLAHGGDRSVDVHIASVKVANPDLIAGKHVLLLDDVRKSGHSLEACRSLLLEAGAKSVCVTALGNTW